jgi:hypothetical protein
MAIESVTCPALRSNISRGSDPRQAVTWTNFCSSPTAFFSLTFGQHPRREELEVSGECATVHSTFDPVVNHHLSYY